MAIIKCSECNSEVSSQAEKCPHCGYVLKKKRSVLKWVLLIFLAVVIINVISAFNEVSKITGTTLPPKQDKLESKSWHYDKRKDEISDKDFRSATATSTNTEQLEFPYQGGTVGYLTVREHPRFGKDIIFQVNKGQILCSASRGCEVSVKFDDKVARKLRANEPSDHSSDTLFLQNYAELLPQIKASKTMIVEITFFQQGSRSFKFNTSELKWD